MIDLSLYDLHLEKAFDSIEHCVLLKSLYEAGINGNAWRLIKACYSNLCAVVKSGSVLSSSFTVSHGVQQGSVLSPTFFIIVIDKLLQQLKETSAGISICGLYLTAHIMLMMYVLLHPQPLLLNCKGESSMTLLLKTA